MNSTKQVLDEFDTNLELPRVAYKVWHMNSTRDRTNLLMQPKRLCKLVTQANQKVRT
jgi:hypothetical protein